MMIKRTMMMTALAALFVVPYAAIAQPFREKQSTQINQSDVPALLVQQENRKELLIEKLNLNDAQKQAIQSIRATYQSEIANKNEALRLAHDEMKALALDGNSSRSQLEEQHLIVANLRRDIGNLMFEQMMDIRDELTVAQREELAQHMEQHMARRWDKWRK